MTISDDLQAIARLLERQTAGPQSLNRQLATQLATQLDRRLTQMETRLNTHLEQIVSRQLAALLPTHLQALAPILSDNLIPRFADGGVLSGDTPMALAGEAGPEAVLPLRRGADGQLGVVADISEHRFQPTAQDLHLHIHQDDGQDRFETDLAATQLPGDMQQLIRHTVANYLAEDETRP